MTRLFRRGELQRAVLDVLVELGPANGYAIMQALADRIGGGWEPSPGAVYPALLGLQDAGLVEAVERDGARDYALSESGRRTAANVSGTLDDVAARARRTPRAHTLGAVLDEFAAGVRGRSRVLPDRQHTAVLIELGRTSERIERILGKES